jgi:PTS system nitrogen regulatory IIA component
MNISVSEAAKLLLVPEETVHQWIRDKKIPAYRERHQFYLNRVELMEWAEANGHRISPDFIGIDGDEAHSDLSAAFKKGGVHRNIPGASREEVLKAIAHLSGIPDGVDREMLFELLLAREKLSSTGLGKGIAFPHPRAPIILRLPDPRVLICFPTSPQDFSAPDKEPIHTLFLLLAPSVRLHLHLLAKLAFSLHDETLKKMLESRAEDSVLLERFAFIEKENAPC